MWLILEPTQNVEAAYFFIAPVLKHISEGRLFSRVFAIAIRIFAVLIALGGIVGWVQAWRMVGDLHGFGVLGGIVFQVVFLIAIYMVTHVLLIRASDIARLPMSEFTVIPIVSIFFRTLGEVYACLISALGAGGCVLILFAGDNDLVYRAMRYMPGTSLVSELAFSFARGADSSFIAANLFLLSSALSAFFALVFFYLLAEGTVVFVDIARNIRGLREAVQPQAPSEPTGNA
jgi:hypothetical protein